jgi:hypothetical protein
MALKSLPNQEGTPSSLLDEMQNSLESVSDFTQLSLFWILKISLQKILNSKQVESLPSRPIPSWLASELALLAQVQEHLPISEVRALWA